MDFNYSIVLDQLIPCIYETVEEADNAPLFKLYMSKMEQLGVVRESTQLNSREYVDDIHYMSTKKEETSSLYPGSDLHNLRHVNMICDASDADK